MILEMIHILRLKSKLPFWDSNNSNEKKPIIKSGIKKGKGPSCRLFFLIFLMSLNGEEGFRSRVQAT